MKVLSNLTLTVLFFLFFACKSATKKDEISITKPSTKTANVMVLDTSFVIEKISAKPKKVWLYLPPDYEASTKNYPVIYMHDGQNLFDDATSFIGEWGVDELLNKLYEKTKKGFIVVAPENGGELRTEEYTPWTHEKYGGGKGDAYIQFIKNDLKPFIDKNYRTKSDPQHTALIGSSLGGLISYYGGLKYPETFGKLGVLSPSFWFSKEVIPFTETYAKNDTLKMYFLLGEKEGMTKEFNATINFLISSGFPKENVTSKIVPSGEHNETFWKSEFLEVIKFLYDI